jgi:GT2 family glycosyltransferase
MALLALDYPPEAFEIVVVDDGPDAATAAIVESLQGRLVKLEVLRQTGLGAATARNAGARSATGDVLLFCDDDMIVAPDHLKLHLNTRYTLGDILLGGNRWYSPEALATFEATPFGRFRVELERRFSSHRDELPIVGTCVETQTLASCDLSIRRETFWALDGFDESFPYAGAEDQDLSTRARQAGLRLIRDYSIRPLHNDPTTTLRQFAEREERGAHTVVALCRKFPQYLGDFRENGPLERTDPPSRAAKKIVKSMLSGSHQLAALHLLANRLERLGMSDPALWRLYRAIVGLHIFRGYRAALSSPTYSRAAD